MAGCPICVSSQSRGSPQAHTPVETGSFVRILGWHLSIRNRGQRAQEKLTVRRLLEVGSRKAVVPSAATRAFDRTRRVCSRSEIDRQSMSSISNHATWLTDLWRSGKLPKSIICSKASKPFGWRSSRSLSRASCNRSPGWTSLMHAPGIEVTSSTRPPGHAFWMHGGLCRTAMG